MALSDATMKVSLKRQKSAGYEFDLSASLELGFLQTTHLNIKKLYEHALVPRRNNCKSAGYELFTPHDALLKPQECTRIDLDIAIQFPENCYGRICGFNQLAFDHRIVCEEAVIDNSLNRSVSIFLYNRNNIKYKFFRGDRVAQLIVESYNTPTVQLVKEFK